MDEANENLQHTPLNVLEQRIADGQPGQEKQAEQTPEETTPPTGEKVEEQTQETPSDLIGGKFKSQDDLLTAYQELEKKATHDAQQKSRYKDELSQFVSFDEAGNVSEKREPVVQPQPTNQPQQQDVLNMLDTRYNAMVNNGVDPIKANWIIQAEMTKAMVDSALSPVNDLKADSSVDKQKRNLRNRVKDFSTFENDIDGLLSDMDAKSKANPKAIETLYYIAKGKKYDDMIAGKTQEEVVKAQVIEKQKEQAQVEHSTVTPEEPPVNPENLTSAQIIKKFGLKTFSRY